MRLLNQLAFESRLWAERRMPERRDRVRVVVLTALICLCAVWVAAFAFGGGATRSSAPSPALRHAKDLERRLRADTAFAGVVITPHIDFADKLHVTGQVPSGTTVDALRAKLGELDPDGVFVIQVRPEQAAR